MQSCRDFDQFDPQIRVIGVLVHGVPFQFGGDKCPEVPSPICSFVPKVGKKEHMEKHVF
jgi:hypothetical protein